jgi:hypothetical protein
LSPGATTGATWLEAITESGTGLRLSIRKHPQLCEYARFSLPHLT